MIREEHRRSTWITRRAQAGEHQAPRRILQALSAHFISNEMMSNYTTARLLGAIDGQNNCFANQLSKNRVLFFFFFFI